MTSPVKTKRKVAELSGEWLDYWVGKADGHSPAFGFPHVDRTRYVYQTQKQADAEFASMGALVHIREYPRYSPSTDWAIGGPIIEREKITLESPSTYTPIEEHRELWFASMACDETRPNPLMWPGKTPLVAAMRCYVGSKFGDTVETEE